MHSDRHHDAPEPGGSPSGPHCTLSQLLTWAGRGGDGSTLTDGIRFALRHVRAESTLVHEGQPFEALYLVSAGSFKCVRNDIEGYEHVLEFAIHGDLLALDALGGPAHASSVVALEDSAVVVIPVADLLALGREVPALWSLVLTATGTEMQRRGETQCLMSAARSEVRIARFLLQLARRQAAIGHSDRRLRLCMTRRDIASHLGVANETVSRALGMLADNGWIRVSHREVELIDPDALRDAQRMTRGRADPRQCAGRPWLTPVRSAGAQGGAAMAARGPVLPRPEPVAA